MARKKKKEKKNLRGSPLGRSKCRREDNTKMDI